MTRSFFVAFLLRLNNVIIILLRITSVHIELSHITQHTSHIQHYTSHITSHKSQVTSRTSHNTHPTLHVTRHTSHITRHTSHITHHTSHIPHHTLLILNAKKFQNGWNVQPEAHFSVVFHFQHPSWDFSTKVKPRSLYCGRFLLSGVVAPHIRRHRSSWKTSVGLAPWSLLGCALNSMTMCPSTRGRPRASIRSLRRAP
jgi:hypothetical protein